jgi:phospholipid/cholesterol/gamma-HCH transport system substrate-binding protein
MTERESRTQLRVGLFVLAAIILFVAFVLTIGSQTRVFRTGYALRASFSSAEGLIEGAPVRLAGLTVGNVTRIGFGRDPGDKRIVVDLSVDRRVQERIREDSVATIGTIGLVGDKYVEVTVGSPDRKILEPLAFLHTIDPMNYGQLLAKGDQIMTSVSKLANTMEEFFAGAGSVDTRRNLVAIIASLRRTLAEVEGGRGLLHALIYDDKGGELVGSLGAAAGAVTKAGETFGRVAAVTEVALGETQAILRDVRQGQGLLHALIYGRADETLGKLAGALGTLDEVTREIREGQGLLHALIYDKEAGQTLARLARAGQAIEDLARAAKEGPGLAHALIADPKGARLVSDLADAAADLKVVTGKLSRGEGTLGALLDDPTLYEDLSTLLRGAERSWILRSVIRSGIERGEEPK